MGYSWEELGALSLARQFPDVPGRDAAAVAAAVGRIGPIQSQTARSPFLGLAARLPGVALEAITAAYDGLQIVRGSNIRGTVHTSTPEDHALLEVATRLGQRTLWSRTLRLESATLEEVWRGIEDFARDEWRTPAELADHLRDWVARHDPGARPTLDDQAGRYFGFGHGGLLRRPLTGGWHRQGAPGYRAAAALLGDRTAVLADPDGAVDALVRRHIGCYGPSSRHDIAWWSGLGLRTVDAGLRRLQESEPALTQVAGPDDRAYLDLPGAVPPTDLAGPHLLPEFDALLCGYDPKARERFVDREHYPRLWSRANGMVLAPLLLDNRLTGYWRIPGTGRDRPCEVAWFAGTQRPSTDELESSIASVEAAYDISVTRVALNRV